MRFAEGVIGSRIEEIGTPALTVDLGALQRNIDRMAAFGREHGIAIRPHAKAHKSAAIAQMQLAAGAIGVCCQTVREAEAMAQCGVPDILVSNEVVQWEKLPRLIRLARSVRLTVAVDSNEGAERLSGIAQQFGVRVGVVIDIDVGQGRCGVPPGPAAVELGRFVAELKGLTLRGLQGYHGRAQLISGYKRRREAAASANALLMSTREAFARAGLPVDVVTGAGTGTYEVEGHQAGMTELQPGSYIFMDRQYLAVGGPSGSTYDDFESSLSVVSTVISSPSADRVVVDAGLKALTNDAGPAGLIGLQGWSYEVAGDEHGILRRTNTASTPLRVGEKVRVMPSYCDTTVNLHNWFYVLSDEAVVDLWPILARGY